MNNQELFNCPICKKDKTFLEFNSASLSINKRCIECLRKYKRIKAKERYDKDPISNLASSRKWREKIGKEGVKDLTLRNLYGITLEEYNKLYKTQKGLCLGCNEPDKDRQLSVDHDHLTDKIRGLLCRNCNVVLGLIEDKPNTLIRLRDYLIKHSNLEKEFTFQHD